MGVLGVAALIAAGVSTVSLIVDMVRYNKVEKPALEAQEERIEGLYEAQEEQVKAEEAATQASIADQSSMFKEQASTFQGAQRQQLSMAGVSLTGGSALAVQRETAQKIEQDRQALARSGDVALSAFGVQEEGLKTEYEQSLADIDAYRAQRKAGMFQSGLGILTGLASPIGNYYGNKGSGKESGFGFSKTTDGQYIPYTYRKR